MQNAKYASYEEALKHGDGLAIVAVFLNVSSFDNNGNDRSAQESHDDNPALAPIINKVDKVLYKDDVLPLERGFDVRALLPDKVLMKDVNRSRNTCQADGILDV